MNQGLENNPNLFLRQSINIQNFPKYGTVPYRLRAWLVPRTVGTYMKEEKGQIREMVGYTQYYRSVRIDLHLTNPKICETEWLCH